MRGYGTGGDQNLSKPLAALALLEQGRFQLLVCDFPPSHEQPAKWNAASQPLRGCRLYPKHGETTEVQVEPVLLRKRIPEIDRRHKAALEQNLAEATALLFLKVQRPLKFDRTQTTLN
jgi:hypothetical protein